MEQERYKIEERIIVSVNTRVKNVGLFLRPVDP